MACLGYAVSHSGVNENVALKQILREIGFWGAKSYQEAKRTMCAGKGC